jgi:hypothetical protein
MMTVIDKIKKSTKEEGSELVDLAKKHYGDMARCWWEFAKTMALIKETKAYESKGYNSFKDWCLNEYPSLNEKVLLKLSLIVNEWFDVIEARLKKDRNFVLPSYETCYRLAAAARSDDLPEEDISKLKKEVLDEKLSFHGLIEKIKSKTKSSSDEPDSKASDIEKQLIKDISEEDLDDDFDEGDKDLEDVESEEFDSADDIFDEDIDNSSRLSDLLQRLKRAVDVLNDNLPILTDQVDKIANDDATEHFAESLNQLMDSAEAFFTALEEAQ